MILSNPHIENKAYEQDEDEEINMKQLTWRYKMTDTNIDIGFEFTNLRLIGKF